MPTDLYCSLSLETGLATATNGDPQIMDTKEIIADPTGDSQKLRPQKDLPEAQIGKQDLGPNAPANTDTLVSTPAPDDLGD